MHFPLKLLPENASHSERSFRDTVSACGPVGKVHPALRARSEMQFPLEGCSGKRVPFRVAIPGHSFRRYKATVRHPYHMPSNMRSRNTKQQIECSFQKVHVPKLTKTSYPATVHGRRLPPTDSNKKYVAKSRPSTCMVRFWSAFGQLSGKFQLIRFCYPKGGGSS